MRHLCSAAVITASFCSFAPMSSGFAQDVPVPQYRVDPFWPKVPYPNGWLQQGVPTMTVDGTDLSWVAELIDAVNFTEPVPLEVQWTWLPGREVKPFNCELPADRL